MGPTVDLSSVLIFYLTGCFPLRVITYILLIEIVQLQYVGIGTNLYAER